MASWKDGFYLFSRFWSQVLGTVLFDVKVYGTRHIPLRGGVLIASNHESYLDPWIIGQAVPRPATYLAREGLFRVPVLSGLLRALKTYPVSADPGASAALRIGIRLLKEQRVLVLFPEGTRSQDGVMVPFKRGVALLAARAEVPVVPAAVSGSFGAWPRTRRLPRLLPIQVAFGEPVGYDKGVSDYEGFLADLERRVRRMLDAMRR